MKTDLSNWVDMLEGGERGQQRGTGLKTIRRAVREVFWYGVLILGLEAWLIGFLEVACGGC